MGLYPIQLPSFYIADISNGEFQMIINDHLFTMEKHMAYDVPNTILRALADLIEGKESEVEITWSGLGFVEYELILRRVDDNLYINTECERSNDNIIRMAKAVLWQFELYENGNGRKRYDSHYIPFPQQEYDRLKQLVKSSKNK